MKLPVYLDNHSTTPADPRVVEAMAPYWTERFGNAASKGHAHGWSAESAVDEARGKVAGLIGGRSNEIVWTSGATEANNLALFGVADAYRNRGKHIVSVETEHKAVLDPLAALSERGWDVTLLRPERSGLVSAQAVADAMTEETVLVSVMHGQNEVGVVQPLKDIATAVKARKASCLVHTDAAQSALYGGIDVDDWQLDLVSLSAHKMYGPKGVGALWVRRRPRAFVTAQMLGGGHQGGMRAGTLPVPLIVGFGRACELSDDVEHIRRLRDRLWAGLENIEGAVLNGTMASRLPGNLNVSFAGVEGDALLMSVAKDIAVSSGAACSSASQEPSYVLEALGVEPALAQASLRFGVGRFSTEADIDAAIAAVSRAVDTLRA